MSSPRLSTIDHSRDSARLRYVYPVVSRRAGGVSIGMNLNTNNACNWRCVYCQVPELVLGEGPEIDLPLLERELDSFLQYVLHGGFMLDKVPAGMRRLNDIALSGNGEPTSCHQFEQVIELIASVRGRYATELDGVKTVLISNGSLLHRPGVQAGLRRMAALNGEVWFKLDRATSAGMQQINNSQRAMEKVFQSIVQASHCCPTWLQTCWFAMDGQSPDELEVEAYLAMLQRLALESYRPRGVLLYGLARPSMQPEASRLQALKPDLLQQFAASIEALNFPVRVSM